MQEFVQSSEQPLVDLASMIPPTPQESRLIYNKQRNCWEGKNKTYDIWISDATFQRYVTAWLEGHRVVQPTQQQMEIAIQYCARLAYWQDCERNYDQNVHVSRPSVRSGNIPADHNRKGIL
jgi:hypothetical protein